MYIYLFYFLFIFAAAAAHPHVNVMLPPFHASRPAAWFSTVDDVFRLRGITDQRDMFAFAYAKLEEAQLQQVDNIVEMSYFPPQTKKNNKSLRLTKTTLNLTYYTVPLNFSSLYLYHIIFVFFKGTAQPSQMEWGLTLSLTARGLISPQILECLKLKILRSLKNLKKICKPFLGVLQTTFTLENLS